MSEQGGGGLPNLSSRIELNTGGLDAAVGRVTAVVDRISGAVEGAGQRSGESLGEGIVRGADGRLRDARGRFVASASETGRSMGGGMSEGFKASFLGNLGANALQSVISTVTNFATGSVDAFAAVEDATGAAGVLFGPSAQKVEDFASRAASAYGLSKSAALDASGTFGTLGKGAGLAGDDLSTFATDLSGLAGDLASFKGKPTEQAVEAVGAALRGEAEPIRAFGVLLDESTIKAAAVREGLIKTTKEGLTPQQKVLATHAAILAQTKDAQGDFARTSDSTANTQKRMTAEAENQQAVLGQRLAPAVTAIREALIQLIGGLSSLLDWFSQNIDIIGPLAAVVGVATVALQAQAIATTVVSAATRVWTAVQAAFNLVMSANPIALVIIAIVALVAAIYIAYQRSETFRNVVQTAMAAIKVAIGVAMEYGRQIIAAVMDFINGKVGGTMGTVREIIGVVMGWVQTYITAQLTVVRTIVGAVFNFISGNVTGRMATVRNVVASVIGFVGRFIGDTLQGAKRIVSGVLNVIAGLFTGNFDRAREGAVEALGGLIRVVTALPRRILSALAGLGKLLLNVGGDLVQGLIDGIRGAAGRVGDAARALANKIPGPIKKLLGISSPSKLTFGYGQDTGEGLALGVEAKAGRVAQAAQRLAGIASGAPGSSALSVGVGARMAEAAGAASGPVDLSPASLATLARLMAPVVKVLLDGREIGAAVDAAVGGSGYDYRRNG